MPRKKSNDPRSAGQAIDSIFKGLKYFLQHEPWKTMIVLMFVFGSALYILYDVIVPEKIQIKDAEPLNKPTSSLFMENAYAGDQGIPIIFDGQIYGYEDTMFVAKVVEDAPVILVFDKATHKVKKVEFQGNAKMKFRR